MMRMLLVIVVGSALYFLGWWQGYRDRAFVRDVCDDEPSPRANQEGAR